MKANYRIAVAALFLSIMAMAGQLMAHSGAMGVVKKRMDAMTTLGEHAKAVGDMLKGKTVFELAVVEAAAQAFVTHGEQIPTLFPDTDESRTGSKTEALPAIWENWADFTALSEKLTDDSRALAAVTAELSNGAQSAKDQSRVVRAAFFRTSKSCSGCHERFRLDKD